MKENGGVGEEGEGALPRGRRIGELGVLLTPHQFNNFEKLSFRPENHRQPKFRKRMREGPEGTGWGRRRQDPPEFCLSLPQP